MMQKLNYPSYTFKLKTNENKTLIFDIVRKKYVTLTPEEWVRQHTIHYLFKEKNYPISLMAVEKQLKIRTLRKRIDIVSYTNDGIPFLIVECKAPSVQISQDTFDQIARYNLKLEAHTLARAPRRRGRSNILVLKYDTALIGDLGAGDTFEECTLP